MSCAHWTAGIGARQIADAIEESDNEVGELIAAGDFRGALDRRASAVATIAGLAPRPWRHRLIDALARCVSDLGRSPTSEQLALEPARARLDGVLRSLRQQIRRDQSRRAS